MRYVIIGLILVFLSGSAILGTQAYKVMSQISVSLTAATNQEN